MLDTNTSNLPRSTSSILKEFLLTQPLGYTFTSLDLRSATGQELAEGAISGFLHRASACGAITAIAKDKKVIKYTLSNEALLQELVVHTSPGPGGQRGAQHGAHRMRQLAPTPKAIQEQIVDLADALVAIGAKLELMRQPLESYSTEELIKELGKRALAQSGSTKAEVRDA